MSKKDSILLIISTKWWNAEAHYALNSALALQNGGWQVWAVVDSRAKAVLKFKAAGINTIDHLKLGSINPLAVLFSYLFLTKFITRHDISFLNTFQSNSFLLSALLKLKQPLRLTWIITRGRANPPKFTIFNKLLYGKLADGVIAVSDLSYRWLTKLVNDKRRLATIYYSSPALRPVSGHSREQARFELTISNQDIVFCLLGRSQPLKGHLEAITALSYAPKNVKLLFLIKNLDEYPEQLALIKKEIARLKLNKQVLIKGHRNLLANDLLAVDWAIVPSLASEINCRVVVEMFSMGIPCLVYPTGSLPELVKEGYNGAVCSEKNAIILAKKIKQLVANFHNREYLGNNAYKEYQTKYSLPVLLAMTNNFLKQVVAIKNNSCSLGGR